MMGEIYRNKKLLDFLYVLTQEEVALNLSKMSKIKLKDNKNITEPTIKSWFRELKKDENFFFYPIVNYEMFQLQPLFIIYERDKPIEIKEENYLPKKVFSYKTINLKNLKLEYIEYYLIPKEDIILFKEKVLKIEPNAKFLKTKSEYILYNKFQDMFNNEGNYITKNGTFSKEQLDRLLASFSEEIKDNKNELIKYILLDSINGCKNSYEVWESLKKNINVEDYFYRENKDSIGIKRIQVELSEPSLKVQNKLYYPQTIQNLQQVLIQGSFPYEEIIKILEEVGNYSICVSVWAGEKSIISIHTNHEGMNQLLYLLKNPKIKDIEIYFWMG